MQKMKAIDKLEDTNKAIADLKALSNLARKTSVTDTAAIINLKLSAYYFDYSISFDSAIHYCDQALSSIQENIEENKNTYLKAWYRKGYYYRKWDKYDRAKEALNIVLDAPENDYTYQATWQLGKLYKDRGEFALAFKYYQQALELAGDDVKKQIRIFEYISFAYIIMDTDDAARSAIYWLNKLEHGLRSLPDRSEDDYLPLVYYNKASCYYELGDLNKAESLVDKAARELEICCDDPDFMGLILDFRGYMDYERGNYQAAIEKYKKGIELFEYSYDLGRGEGVAGSYYAIAEAYHELGLLDSALHYANLTIIDRTFGFDNNLEHSHFPSIDEMLQNGEKAYLIEDLILKGAILETKLEDQSSKLEEVILQYELAEQVLDAMTYEHIEEDTKIFWRQTAKSIYYHLVRLYLKDNRPDQAFLLSEKSKYVILEEHLRKARISKQQASLPLINEYQLLLDSIKEEEVIYENDQLASFSERKGQYVLVDLRRREDDLIERIKLIHPKIYSDIFSWNKPDIRAIQSSIAASNSVLIEYFVHDSMSYAFVLDGHTITSHQLEPRVSLVNQVKAFLSTFNPQASSLKSAATYEQEAFNLFSSLLDTMDLYDKSEVIIVPDDVLTLLPFEVLVYQGHAKLKEYHTLDYLLRWKPLRYLINAKSIVEKVMHDERESSERVVSFVPNFGDALSDDPSAQKEVLRNGLMPLLGAKKEVETLCKIFQCKAYDEAVGEQLFYDQLQHQNNIIHVATHARMNDSLPSQSHLIMQSVKDSFQDNFIHLFELKNKVIKSNLVVLSACNTGIGKIYRGEGLASLGIAFHYAGSPNLVTSLWSIPDHASSIIMQQFFENLHNKLPKHYALRDAKLAYLNQYAANVKHPFFWGGLLYYGDGLPLDGTSASTLWEARWTYAVAGVAVLILLYLIFAKSNYLKVN